MLYPLGAAWMTWKRTHSLTHPHAQRAKTKTGRETESICALIAFTQGSESAPERALIGIPSSYPTLMFFVPLPAVSGLIFSHEAGSEIWLYLSVPWLPDRQPDNRSARYHLICTCTYSDFNKRTLCGIVLWITVYNLFDCRSIESLSQLHNSNLVTSMAEPSGELKLSGRLLNDVLPTL